MAFTLEAARPKIAGEIKVAALDFVPLAEAALCVNCEAVYRMRGEGCPACGSRIWASLGRWLSERRAS